MEAPLEYQTQPSLIAQATIKDALIAIKPPTNAARITPRTFDYRSRAPYTARVSPSAIFASATTTHINAASAIG